MFAAVASNSLNEPFVLCVVVSFIHQTWQTAMGPDYTIIQIQAQAIVTAAGVLHCICMHVPAFDKGSGTEEE